MKKIHLLFLAIAIVINSYGQADKSETILYGDVKDKASQNEIPCQ